MLKQKRATTPAIEGMKAAALLWARASLAKEEGQEAKGKTLV